MINTPIISTMDFTPVNISSLKPSLENLSTRGHLKFTNDNFVYADIDDDYIHKIYPLIAQKELKNPSYFDKETNSIGAHISIIYPEEGAVIDPVFPEIGPVTEIDFKTCGLFSVRLLNNE